MRDCGVEGEERLGNPSVGRGFGGFWEAVVMRLLSIVLLAFVGIVPTAASPGSVSGGSTAAPAASLAASAQATPQPNFVVVLSDDQKWDSIGRCLPVFDPYDFNAGADACMPNLQADLMAAGTTFLKGEVTQSLCCPSRASILTGQYSTTHGVTVNDGTLFNDSSTLATWLNDAGYRTGLFGKYLNGYGEGPLENYIPPGWDAFESYYAYRVSNGDNPYTDYPWISWEQGDPAPVITRYNNLDSTSSEACAVGNLYSTDLICRLSLDFLAANQTDPFFLYLTPVSPHSPYTIAERHRGRFAAVDIAPYPDSNLVPSPNPPAHLPTTPLSDLTLAHQEAFQLKILELTLTVDDMIGALHDQLAADGRLDETVWIYLSDNGIASGEHRWTDKKCEYYACHRVPFVVVCPPAICAGAQGGVPDPNNYALNIDIAPTIAELAGVTPTLTVDGRSLVPILNNPAAAWRTEWFMHGDSPEYSGIVGVGLDGHTYKYVTLTARGGTIELFDLDEDPWELINLGGDGAHAAVEADLAARLAAHLSGGPPANMAPSAAFTESCPNLTCIFSDGSSDSDGSITSWAWTFGDGTASTAQNPSHTYSAPGSYSVTLTVTDDDGATGVASHTVTVADPSGPPVASFTSGCGGFTCDFTDTSTGSVVSWAWDFGDGGSSAVQHPSHTYGVAGTYTVELTVTSGVGEQSTTSSSVTVTEPGATMHIADLDGSSVRLAGGSWMAIVDVHVDDDGDSAVSGAEVTGVVHDGTEYSCTTSAAGSCQVQFTTRGARAMFTVTGVSHASLTYESEGNGDPDGDSDGTVITVLKPNA